MDHEDADATAAEQACFEAGIKFGTLYHQFAGTPVSPASADSLETAIEESIQNQPFCASVSVEILEEPLAGAIEHGYTELTGRFLDVEIVVERDDTRVVAQMQMDDGYPLMAVDAVESI